MSVGGWPLSRFRRAHGARPLVFGHRGVRRPEGAAENTLAAFEAAAREGADGIELDARLAATGELVVFHDATLARMTGGADGRAVADLSFAELRQAELPRGERVPLVADALALARERGLAVNVEIKHDAPDRAAVVRAAARLLHTWDPAHAVLVSSFDPAMLAGIRLTLPRVPIAQLVHKNRYSGPAARAAALVADAVHIERVIASRSLIDAIKRRGRVVSVWTVNSAVEARDLAALGVDGLISDVPGDVLAALGAEPPPVVSGMLKLERRMLFVNNEEVNLFECLRERRVKKAAGSLEPGSESPPRSPRGGSRLSLRRGAYLTRIL